MANPRVVFTLVVVFLAGAATGMLTMRYGLHERLHTAGAADNREAVLERFRSELHLTPGQTEQLRAVLDDYEHYYKSVEDQIRDLRLREQIEDLRATGKSRIMEILNEEQRAKFEKMMPEFASPER